VNRRRGWNIIESSPSAPISAAAPRPRSLGCLWEPLRLQVRCKFHSVSAWPWPWRCTQTKWREWWSHGGAGGASRFQFRRDGVAKCRPLLPTPPSLAAGGCFVDGNSSGLARALASFGRTGLNILRDTAFKNVEFSGLQDVPRTGRFLAPFRLSSSTLLNHPLIANPYVPSVNGGGRRQ